MVKNKTNTKYGKTWEVQVGNDQEKAHSEKKIPTPKHEAGASIFSKDSFSPNACTDMVDFSLVL